MPGEVLMLGKLSVLKLNVYFRVYQVCLLFLFVNRGIPVWRILK